MAKATAVIQRNLKSVSRTLDANIMELKKVWENPHSTRDELSCSAQGVVAAWTMLNLLKEELKKLK